MTLAVIPSAARLWLTALLTALLVACQMPTAGPGVSLTPVATLGRDAAGGAALWLRVPTGGADRRVLTLPSSWDEAVVTFDSTTARVQPYSLTIPRTAFNQVAGGVITTIAGDGTAGAGGDGGLASAARLNAPHGMILDRDGNLLIADAGNHRVRKITLATGQISTVAGTGVAGYAGDGGQATAAQLDSPDGVAVDAAGNLYIADADNYAVRRVDAVTGVITTYAGGTFGDAGDGGPATSARLAYAGAVAVDATGHVYVADISNCRVRRIEAGTGVITTVAGTGVAGFSGDGGPGTAAELDYPDGLAVDVEGNLLIADQRNHRVRKLNLETGIITTIAGTGAASSTGDGGPATAATLSTPHRVAVDSAGNMFIAEAGGDVVRRIDAVTGVITTVAGTGATGYAGDGGQATAAQLDTAYEVAVDATGTMYILEGGNHCVRRVTGSYAEYLATAATAPALAALRPATDYTVGVDLRTAGSPATLEAFGFLSGQVLQAGPNALVLTMRNHLNAGLVAGTPEITDGTGAAVFFENPSGVVVDATGTYAYVADRDNHCIRRLEVATGAVTTLAGNGEFGESDGAAADARFYSPAGVALAGTSLYVADSMNNGIRKIDLALAPTDGNFVTTVAGLNGWYFANGSATTAAFADPQGIAVEPDESAIYVADTGNYRIRKIDLTLPSTDASFVTTLSGSGTPGFADGSAAAARFDEPCGLALDGAGNLYVADYWSQMVRRVTTATGAAASVAYTGASGYPYGLAFDGTDLWVSDHLGNGRIQKVTLAGVVTAVAGGTVGFADGAGAAARFSHPSGLAVIPGGDLLIADRDNHAIRRMVRASGAVTTMAGSHAAGWVDGPLATARFRSVTGVCVTRDREALYVADQGNHRIRKIDLLAGTVSTVAGEGFAGFLDGTGAAARFDKPTGVAVNDAGTTLYVTDRGNRRIRAIDLATGAVTNLAGSGAYSSQDGTGALAAFRGPAGITMDASGYMYVADQFGQNIRRVTTGGTVWTLAGTAGASGSNDGIGGGASFFGPKAIVADRLGYLYVADAYNQAIRRIRISGAQVTTVAGLAGTTGSADGPGTSARLIEPWGIAADPAGNVYFSDIYLNSVRKIARDGYVTTVAGGTPGFRQGRRSAARFSGLTGLAADTTGAIYVADTDNHAIRRIQ